VTTSAVHAWERWAVGWHVAFWLLTGLVAIWVGATTHLTGAQRAVGFGLVALLAAVEGGKVQLAAGVTADRMGQVKAGELVNYVARQVGGKGGGKADLAMAGGTDAAALPAALASVVGWVRERV